jgi:hypothetical protein
VPGILTSCTIGTEVCDDSNGVETGLLPWWGLLVVALVLVALAAWLIGILVRSHRRRPWD